LPFPSTTTKQWRRSSQQSSLPCSQSQSCKLQIIIDKSTYNQDIITYKKCNTMYLKQLKMPLCWSQQTCQECVPNLTNFTSVGKMILHWTYGPLHKKNSVQDIAHTALNLCTAGTLHIRTQNRHSILYCHKIETYA
jgi:hypothetical protein